MILKKCVVYVAAFCLTFQACELLEVDTPANKIVGDDIFLNSDTATAAIVGIYADMASKSNIFSGAASIHAGLYGDELVYRGSRDPVIEFSNSTISLVNPILETIFWNQSYAFIYRSNKCQEGLSKSNALSSQLRDQLLGEAKLLRAMFYFHMIQFFGEVPLVTMSDHTVSERMARTPLPAIKETILADLRVAKALLLPAYPTPERVRANKWSAAALLARFYLYESNWDLAEKECTEIINSGQYALEGLNNVFLSGSKEAILQLLPVTNGYNTLEGNMLIPPGSGIPSYTLSASLMSQFEPGDKRKTAWTGSNTSGGIAYYYPFKYKKRADQTQTVKATEYPTIFRVAEIYLIRAECNAALGRIPAAMNDLDVIRRRAGLPLIAATHPGISATALMQQIQHERRIELFAESGHRWFDLKRSGTVHEVMKSLKPAWNDGRHLWPIPAPQIAFNPTLVQNPGY
jgi:hypothetical protein